MKAYAILRKYPVSPRKVRFVANLVRGAQIDHALSILKFQPSPNARHIEKLLLSAVANWQVKYPEAKVSESSLSVQEVRVDAAPMLKRYRPAPHGRAQRIRKRSSHISLCVGVAAEVAQVPSDGQK